jgi:ribonuclease P protein component
MIKFKSLNQSRQFLKILRKKRINTKYFTIYFEKNFSEENSNLNISFVIKKNIGNAVRRNKIRRKLRGAVQKIIKEKRAIDLSYTYVIFGRNNVYNDKSLLIVDEFDSVFKRIKQIDK